jgi:uncharacterized protein (TIGR02117 family)
VVARADVSPNIWPEIEDLGPFSYVEVGWGDGDYYPAARGTPVLALKAAFRSRSSVLHAVGFDTPVERFFPHSTIVAVDLSPGGFDRLCRYVHESYVRDRDSRRIVTVAPAAYGHGFFYLARGHYALLHNSNHWTATALKVAGCPVEPDDALTAGSVLHQARRFGELRRAGWLLRAVPGDALRCE